MPAPHKNRNAAKPAKDRASVIVTVRATRAEVAQWKHASKAVGERSLAQFVRRAANRRIMTSLAGHD